MKINNVIGANNIVTEDSSARIIITRPFIVTKGNKISKVCIMNITAIGVILGLLIAASSMWG
jgi:hypothetical protein